MTISRYRKATRINFGTQLGVSTAVMTLRTAIKNGTLPVINQLIITENTRLDTLAGDVYGEGRYWWVLAAASDIGWGMQIPPGTVINVIDLDKLTALLR